MIDFITSTFTLIQAGLFEHLVEPALHALGLMAYLEPAFDATEFVLLGLLEMALLVVLFRPLEAIFPVEYWPSRSGVNTDILYTALHRLGFIPLMLFVVLLPLSVNVDEWLRLQGFIPYTLDDVIPGLFNHPALTFLVYLLVLDFVGYWVHRFQHRLGWWWALHSLHHSQRTMSYWTDDRAHLLDDLLNGVVFTLVSLLIGVPPGQFLLLLMTARMVQSLAHANLSLSFGPVGQRILVSPRFHRIHHGMTMGSVGGPQSCNFAVLFPLWDMVFGTANFTHEIEPTGIDDQLLGRDYGEGFWRQQSLGLQRFWAALWGQTLVGVRPLGGSDPD